MTQRNPNTQLPSVRVLVVDDDDACRRTLCRLLEARGYEPVEAENALVALRLLEKRSAEVLITDLCMPDMSGIDLIRRVKALDACLPCILITGRGSAESAVDALRAGAFWYLPKPFVGGIETLARLVERALDFRRLAIRRSRSEPASTPREKRIRGIGQMIGQSPQLGALKERIERVAPLDSTVLILGESGCGKELVARALHAKSARADGPFIAVNCGAIPEDLLESELFGHVRGAFTHATENREGRFAAADGGTLFLDEIGDMSPRFQVKMLRVLQSGDFQAVGSSKTQVSDVRIVSATHQNVKAAVAEGRLREDLYYRIAVIPLEVPALRERSGDIPLLVEHFTERFRHSSGREVAGLSQDALAALEGYAWPGNIRELENLVERLLVLSDGHEVGPDDLPHDLGSASAPRTENAGLGRLDFREAVGRLESDLILRALSEAKGNKSAAAASLGIKRTTLLDMIRRKRLDAGGVGASRPSIATSA
jgi:DNA-binding NtrC family response regulator